MECKDVIARLRQEKGLSQEDLAEKLFVTRQAVSRWENGDTTPNVETLKMLSRLFDVSINTLLGSPRQLICQCCGMPLTDGVMARDPDGALNEEYCQWCLTDGQFVYRTMEELVEFLVNGHFIPNLPDDQARELYRAQLSTLRHWQE